MTQRIAHIDGLRAVAALAVVVFHDSVHMAARPDPGTPIGITLRATAHGVDLFFVLSGFCLAYPYLLNKSKTGATAFGSARYAAKRLVRILPPYYAAIGVLLLLGIALVRAHVPLPQSMDPASLQPAEVLRQMLFAGQKYLANPFWTLAIEFRWYFLFPVVLWVWTRSRLAFALIGVASLVTAETKLHSYDLFFLPIFMLGIVAADAYINAHRAARFAILALPLALFTALESTIHDGWYFVDRDPTWGIAMFCLVVAVGASPLARYLLSRWWIVALGAASYSIYLIHEPIVEITGRNLQYLHNPAGEFVLTFCVATAAGAVFSYIAERPFVFTPLKNVLVSLLEQLFCKSAAVLRSRVALIAPPLQPQKLAGRPDPEVTV